MSARSHPAPSRDLARRAADEVNARYAAAHSELAQTGGGPGRGLESGFAAAQGALRIERPGDPRPSQTDATRSVFSRCRDRRDDRSVLPGIPGGRRAAAVRGTIRDCARVEPSGGVHRRGRSKLRRVAHVPAGVRRRRYSGWLFLYSQAIASLPANERAAVGDRLLPGPRRDLEQIAERVRREVRPRVSAAGWRVYDQYLKANRVEAGTASYAQVVRLVLGSRSAGLF